jgi:hypothetical protein
MRPLPVLIAASGLAVTTVSDHAVAVRYTAVSESVATFVEALALKEGLIHAGTCTF